MNAPTLAAITFKPSGGGVAVVSQLLWDVVSRRSGAQSLVLLRGDRRLPSLPEKVRYAVHLAAKQIAGVTGGIVFAHLGLAKPMRNIPRAFRKPYAIFLHGIEAWRPLTSREHALLAGADLRLANSNYTAARVMEMHPAIGPVVACPLALPVGWSDAAGASDAS